MADLDAYRDEKRELAAVLQGLCVAGALWFSGCFIFVALMSMRYPFQMEWMEGQFVDVVYRVMTGRAIYVEPHVEYVPFPYTPYYFYVSAFVALFTGIDFFPARLVSFLAACGCGAMLYAWVRKEGGRWQTGLIAAGLFFATYRLSGRWFDIARVDSLFLFLNLAGLYTFRFYRGFPYAFCAAGLLAFAFFTKQTTLFLILPPLVAGVFLDRRHTLQTIGLWCAMVITVIMILNDKSGGWFNFYAFEISSGHGIQREYLTGFWLHDLFEPLYVLCATAIATLLLCLVTQWRLGLWYGALAAGCVGCSFAARLNWGGYFNVLMPAHALLALLAGLLLTEADRRQNPAMIFLILPVLLLFQMYRILYDPMPMIPTKESVAQGQKFLDSLSGIKGEILMPELQFVQTRIGKTSYDLSFPAMDVLTTDLGEDNYVREKFGRELREAIQSQRFAALMPGRFLNLQEKHGFYKPDRTLVYPREYITGGIGSLSTQLFVLITPAGIMPVLKEPLNETPGKPHDR